MKSIAVKLFADENVIATVNDKERFEKWARDLYADLIREKLVDKYFKGVAEEEIPRCVEYAAKTADLYVARGVDDLGEMVAREVVPDWILQGVDGKHLFNARREGFEFAYNAELFRVEFTDLWDSYVATFYIYAEQTEDGKFKVDELFSEYFANLV